MGSKFLNTTNENLIRNNLHTMLDVEIKRTHKFILDLSKEYYTKKTLDEKIEFFNQFKSSPEKGEQLALLTKYWAIKLQLSTRASIIAAANHHVVSEQLINTTNGINNDEIERQIQQQVSNIKKPELKAVREEFLNFQYSIKDSLPEYKLQETIFQTIRDAKAKGEKIDQVLAKLNNILIELVFTEHPTDPLSEKTDEALKKITKDTSEDDIEELIHYLVQNPLVPNEKRSVMLEVERDNRMLEMMFDIYPTVISSLKKALTTYYPGQQYSEDKLIAISPRRWGGFDADGNFQLRPDRELWASYEGRVRACSKYIEFIEHNLLAHIDDKSSSPIKTSLQEQIKLLADYRSNAIKALRDLDKWVNIDQIPTDKAKSYFEEVKKISENFDVNSITKEILINNCSQIIEQNKNQIEINLQLKNNFNIYKGLIRDFGMGLGRADVRQKSTVNLRVITTIVEDLKNTQPYCQYKIFSMVKDQPFSELPEQDKIKFLEKLEENTPESTEILKVIKSNFDKGYYNSNKELEQKLSSLKQTTEIFKAKDVKLTPLQEVQNELWRSQISSINSDIVAKNIISNTEHASDLFIQDILQKIFDSQDKIVTLPLLESMNDLKNAENILEEYIKFRIQKTLEAAYENETAKGLTKLKIF